jgi:CheY-like chemotaxis protein
MAAEVQSRIFEPFFTTKPLGKGTGLGLSMVYGIVQQSGGHIRLESELDRGTNFRIYFPAVPEEAKAAEHVEEAPQLGRGETVLVAEDEDSLRESIVAYLRQHGYTVLSACDGEEAMQVAREHDGPIHLLLTDVVMPRLEGGELAAELQRKRPGLATLFISGYTDQRLMTRLPDNPRPMVLQKPIKLRDLLNTIGEVMHPVN